MERARSLPSIRASHATALMSLGHFLAHAFTKEQMI
jgi:hypothetical protein